MRFYYISLFSLILLGLIYVFGTMFLVWLGKKVKKRWDGAWKVMVPLFLLLYIGPIAEELWIAWNFGQLCRKDAGIFVYKTVEVEGFYDDTHGWRADKLEKSGFKWVEGRDRTKYEPVYWRHEYVGDEIRSYRIEKPSAKYKYSWPFSGEPVAHKIVKHGQIVTDTGTEEVLVREVSYGRNGPWFFISLDRPVMLCPTREEAPLKKQGVLYKLALKPKQL